MRTPPKRKPRSGCSICTHPGMPEINRMITDGIPYREISKQFGQDPASISRHKTKCIPHQMVQVQVSRDLEGGLAVEREVTRLFGRINKLMDACETWLIDPDDKDKYTLEPRGREIDVIYDDHKDLNERGKPTRKRSSLQELIERAEAGDITIEKVETKFADPRELIIKSAAEIRAHLDFYAKLHGLYQKERTNAVDEQTKKRWVGDKIDEVMLRFGVDEAGARSWLRESFPNVPEFATYTM